MTGYCPECGKDTGDRKFCPFCGTRLSVESDAETRSMPVMPPPLPPPAAGAPPMMAPTAPVQGAPPPGAAPSSRRTTLAIVLGIVALLVIGGIIVAVVLLSGGESAKVEVQVKKPAADQKVSTETVAVEVDVGEAKNVDRLAVYIDGVLKKTMDKAPYKCEVPSGAKGQHELKAVAFDSNGNMLASAMVDFESTGVTGEDTGKDTGEDGQKDDSAVAAYKLEVSSKSAEVQSLDNEMGTMADRINSDLSKGYVSGTVVTAAQNLYGRCASLYSQVQALKPPADYVGIGTQLLELCGYLKTRADALVKGSEAANAGGSYTADFNRGATAKVNFDAVWPKFTSACQAKGISVG